MASTMTRNVAKDVTLATTVTQLTGFGSPPPKTIIISKSDVAVYLVTLSTVTDGGALPATGYHEFATTSLPITFDVSPYGFIGLAAASSGTARVELR